ncbi:MAG TPA: class I SAM-dependent methyltransferase [Thermoanaerobaculia bacterium]|nr:class I SAM-dependent methyltransferase [Thermoanaerobaculia bacterium]
MASFADHFSKRSPDYARYRPGYPDALFDFVAELAPGRALAWDCATGSGQAAAGLAGRFETVLATDASFGQIRSAVRHPAIRYAAATAEAAPLASGSAAAVTSAQALHWFDRPRFWEEVRRVLVPGGVVAIWSYHGFHVTPEVEAVVHRLYRDVVGPYWPPERAIVERGYQELEFPFDRVDPPGLVLEKRWDLAALVGYLRTWSATQRYEAALGADPIPLVAKDLEEAWGPPETVRPFRWDLDILLGRK